MAKKIESFELDGDDRIIALNKNIADERANKVTVQFKMVEQGGKDVYKLIIKKKPAGTLVGEYILEGKIPPDTGA